MTQHERRRPCERLVRRAVARRTARDPRLTSGEKLAGMAVARFADARSRSTYASAPKLARIASASERSVRANVLRLMTAGYLRAAPGPRGSRAWATRVLVLLLPERGAATVSAPRINGAETVAAAKARGPANPASRSGKSCIEVRQPLPTIPRIYPEEEIPGERPAAGPTGRPAPALAENEPGGLPMAAREFILAGGSAVSDTELARRARRAGYDVSTRHVRSVRAGVGS